ncbi:MAG: hypothetical protein H7Y27_14395 [Gemmatimonadaceae bacterium]|nr:hypothetical protein [Chitinophagaceae bacterium]
MTGIRIAIGIVGITTGVIAAYITRVQSTVKTQIAYASVVQIGLIFVEIALGLHVLALVHFSANAFLRTWQLLVSPSVLSYLVHNQFYHFDPSAPKKVNTGFRKISNSLYILSVKEWNLDAMLFRYLWSPFKEIGRGLQGVSTKLTSVILIVLMGIGVYALVAKNSIPVFVTDILPLVFSATTLLLILKAFAERGDARKAWLMIFASQLFMLLAILGNADLGLKEILICLGGASLSAIMGYACLERMHAIDSDILLDKFHGYTFEQPVTGFIFLVSGLGLLGFPVTPTFIGIDLLFSHIGLKQYGLIVFAALSFVFVEIAVLRIYSRVFMGQHKKPSHAIAYRSS